MIGDCWGRPLKMLGAWTFALAIVTGAVACGGQAAGTASAKKFTIGWVSPGPDDQFWVNNTNGATTAGSQLQDATVIVGQGKTQADFTGMVSATEDLLTRHVDALVVPGVPQLIPVLQRAKAQGVKIIFYADGLLGSDLPATTVITNNRSGGELAGTYIKNRLNGKGQLAIIDILRGTYPLLDLRADGVLDQTGPDIQVVAHVDTNCDVSKSVSAMENILTRFPHVNAVFGACAQAAQGAEQAISKAGLTGKIVVVGFDAKDFEIVAIKAGSEDATVAQFPVKEGELAIYAADQILEGKTVAPNIDPGTDLYTKDHLPSS